VVRVEFIVEPFVEGRPGPHVRAAVAAVEQRGFAVDFGPFGSVFDAPADQVGEVVQALLDAAYERGATRVQVHSTPHGDSGSLPSLHGALDRLIESVERELGGRLTQLNREEKQRAVRLLDDAGAFTLRRSVEDVADALGVSRITVYNYLNAIHR
jgi:predicted transcriptional regulator YheO